MMTVKLAYDTRIGLVQDISRRVIAPSFENRNRVEARREADALATSIVRDILARVERTGKMIAPAIVEV